MLPRMRRRSTLAVFIHSLRQPYESKRPEKEVVLLCSFFLLAEDRSKRADLAPQRSFAAVTKCWLVHEAAGAAGPTDCSANTTQGAIPANRPPGDRDWLISAKRHGELAGLRWQQRSQSQAPGIAVWRISVAGRDFARGAQATSSQLCRHKAGLTLSTLDSLKFLWVPACTSSSYVCIIVQSTATASAVSWIA